MGMNFYLKKNDETKWIIPEEKLTSSINLLVVQEYVKGNQEVSLDLSKCVREVELLHIGKSSFGWHFNLCIYPTLNIYNLEDWKVLFNDSDDYTIYDEEDVVLTADEMIDRIENRSAKNFDKFNSIEEFEKSVLENNNKINENLGIPKRYETYDEFLLDNHAERGLNGLLKHSSTIFDMREDTMWKDFMPLILMHIGSNGTYDYTLDYEFS